MGVGFSWVKLFLTGKKKFVAISIIMVVGFLFLWLIIGMGSPSKTQNVVKKQEATKPDVAGVQADPSSAQVSTNESTPTTDIRQQAKLVKVVDGDTISVSINGKSETIRIIGIDTPEIDDPKKTVECFGEKATEMARVTFRNDKTVLLEADPSQGDRDKYQRLLRYIWIGDGQIDFGKFMIGDGYASEYTYDLPYKYQKVYKEAESKALEAKKGLWADDACISVNTTEGDKDCSDFKVQDEAQTYFEGKGGSPTNNVDKLDSDGDGIACESLP